MSGTDPASREKRLAQALKANLARRKARARALTKGSEAEAAPDREHDPNEQTDSENAPGLRQPASR